MKSRKTGLEVALNASTLRLLTECAPLEIMVTRMVKPFVAFLPVSTLFLEFFQSGQLVP